MTFTWLAKRHRTFFFLGTLMAYVATLYIAATPRHDDLQQTLIRLAGPIAELGLAWLICSATHDLALQKRWAATFCYVTVSLLVALVYTAQIYSLYLSGNFISVLAMQNTAESRIVRSDTLFLALLLGISWWLLFVTGFLYERKAAPHPSQESTSSSIRIGRVAAIAILLVVTMALFHLQKDNGLLEADYRQAPLVTFAHNYVDSRRTARATQLHDQPFAHRTPGREPMFPLEKTSIYDHPLPFASRSDPTDPPNVIVIFTEGTSARLLGCYGGQYPGLTPNIDRLAKVSMRVVNYYNHTAATYRGLQGQMVSGYPSAGGGEDSAPWETETGKEALSSVRHRSMVEILKENQYRTYFISPHYDRVGLNTLLRSLGFDKVFSFEDVSHQVAPGNKLYFVEGALSDGDIFNALHILMDKGAITDVRHPFFMGLYNFGTHAFLDVMPDGKRYGDGSNSALNKLHNYDYALGEFLDYFFASPYAKNTILILTSDHATYPDRPFKAVAGRDYKPLFVDRIPLIIYDPTHHLPAVYDAGGRTSIDFAPTLLQLLGIQHGDNSFLGVSLFEYKVGAIGFAAIGNEFFATDETSAYPQDAIPTQYAGEFLKDRKRVEAYYQLEQENRISPAPLQRN
jgi:lipoteichoic acid synthase